MHLTHHTARILIQPHPTTPPPPPQAPTPHGEAAVQVLPGKAPARKGALSGTALAALLAARDDMEVGGWG